MKKILLTIFISSLFFIAYSQENQQIYDPNIDANKVLQLAIKKASKENKHIFIQVGGNWCPWCIKLHNFYTTNKSLDSLLNANYVPVVINYSKENKNLDILKQFEYPQRFGFPVLIILDSEGNKLHTQNTVYLEKDKGYDEKIFIEFLKSWNKAALDPEQYK